MSIESPELADDIRAGDPDAQRNVVEAYLPQVLRASRAAGLDGATAEDVAQSTFLTFFEKAATFEGRSQVRTWLFGILNRKIQEARRKGWRETPTDEIEAFVLREVEGLVSEEICKILSVTRTNLGVLIFRARNRLRECLEAQGVSR